MKWSRRGKVSNVRRLYNWQLSKDNVMFIPLFTKIKCLGAKILSETASKQSFIEMNVGNPYTRDRKNSNLMTDFVC